MKRPFVVFGVLLLVTSLGLWVTMPKTVAQGISLKSPDLIISKLTYQWTAMVDLSSPTSAVRTTWKVCVRNIGSGASRALQADVGQYIECYTAVSAASFWVYPADVPAIPAGGQVEVFADTIWDQAGGMCVATVDVPVPGHPTGQVTEFRLLLMPTTTQPWAGNQASGEHNNAFAFVFRAEHIGMTKPVITNPAAP